MPNEHELSTSLFSKRISRAESLLPLEITCLKFYQKQKPLGSVERPLKICLGRLTTSSTDKNKNVKEMVFENYYIYSRRARHFSLVDVFDYGEYFEIRLLLTLNFLENSLWPCLIMPLLFPHSQRVS